MGEKKLVFLPLPGNGGDWVEKRFLDHVERCREEIFETLAVPEDLIGEEGGSAWPKITMTYEQFYNTYGGYPSEFGIGDV